MAAQYGFRRIGTTVGENARCQRCDNEEVSNLAHVWEWSGNQKPPSTPRHRFEDYEWYAKSDERGLYLQSRGGKWRLVREPLLSLTEKYNRADSSESEIEILCQSCRRQKRGQVERDNRMPGRAKKSTRQEVMERDGQRCVSCGEVENLQVDHITAVAEGGDGSLENLQTLCGGCHVQKTLQEDTGLGGTGRPWKRLWGTTWVDFLRLPDFEVEARPSSVAGRECISFFFSYRKPGLGYEITPSVPIAYGLEGFRDLALYRHGEEPNDIVFCKSVRNTQAGLQELHHAISILGSTVLTGK